MRPGKMLLLALAAAGAAGSISASASVAAQKTVHMRGTAYRFNEVGVRLQGAVIKVEEYPKISTTVGANGAYDLVVPANAKAVTPYIQMNGYYGIHLQTFTTKTSNLANVNFQVPTDGVAEYMMMLLNVKPIDQLVHPWRLPDCVIVSTFSTRNVRNLDFAGFIGYGAHGVAGATASGSPSLKGDSAPVYFNDSVVPDRKVKSSSIDGGVLFPHVKRGTYTITAKHPTARFSSFKATCRPGWVVNANPPWGLYQTR